MISGLDMGCDYPRRTARDLSHLEWGAGSARGTMVADGRDPQRAHLPAVAAVAHGRERPAGGALGFAGSRAAGREGDARAA